ncbi:SPFH domain-containing protein [Jonesia quinghaiensis]|uniref:SPFH domain-containing protein n=1 Tax=Jonesia quinghaiensis TaxID=262806 RepID=UPI0003FBF5E9|nr:SPFH domain-containing protein [Jonesia quinghaiensis]
MSVIRTFPAFSHYLGSANADVIHLNRGALKHRGIGQSFWFRPQTSVISEVPATDQEQPVVFHVITRDQQDVTVQVNVTYRFTDAHLASQRLDFGVFPARRKHEQQADGRQRVGVIIGQSAQSIGVTLFATLNLNATLEHGIIRLHEALIDGLTADPRLTSTGIEILGVRVLSVRPETAIEKALQTPVRERLQSEADRATYERRAQAVERERTISETELASKIELARRREDLLTQEGANAQREARETAASALITTKSTIERSRLEAASSAERKTLLAEARAAEITVIGQAEANKENALMQAYATVGRDVLTALALRDAAAALPNIGNLTVTPDVLTGLLGNLLGGGTQPTGGPNGTDMPAANQRDAA